MRPYRYRLESTDSFCRQMAKLGGLAKMKLFDSVFTLAIGVAALIPGAASADIYDWSFGGGSDNVSGSGSFTATLVDGATFPGLYQISGGTGTITDSTGAYNVSVAGLFDNYGGVQGLCGNVVDTNAECNTVRGANGSGANYTFDNLLYTGASQGGGQLFDADGIGFVVGGASFLLTTTGYSGNGGGALYCGPGSPECEGLNNTLSVTLSSTPTPEPSYGFLALGLLGMIVGVRRWKTRAA